MDSKVNATLTPQSAIRIMRARMDSGAPLFLTFSRDTGNVMFLLVEDNDPTGEQVALRNDGTWYMTAEIVVADQNA